MQNASEPNQAKPISCLTFGALLNKMQSTYAVKWIRLKEVSKSNAVIFVKAGTRLASFKFMLNFLSNIYTFSSWLSRTFEFHCGYLLLSSSGRPVENSLMLHACVTCMTWMNITNNSKNQTHSKCSYTQRHTHAPRVHAMQHCDAELVTITATEVKQQQPEILVIFDIASICSTSFTFSHLFYSFAHSLALLIPSIMFFFPTK